MVIASLDSAFTEKQENDPSALTVWGVFKHPATGKTRVILIDAWRKHLQMHGSATPRLDHEILRLGDDAQVRRYKDTLWAKRVGKAWGLVEWTVHTMRKWGASILLIEGKASGLTVHHKLLVHPIKIEHAIDLPDQMIGRYHLVEIECIKELALPLLSPPHHRPLPRIIVLFDGITVHRPSQREFCNTITPLATKRRTIINRR